MQWMKKKYGVIKKLFDFLFALFKIFDKILLRCNCGKGNNKKQNRFRRN